MNADAQEYNLCQTAEYIKHVSLKVHRFIFRLCVRATTTTRGKIIIKGREQASLDLPHHRGEKVRKYKAARINPYKHHASRSEIK